MSSTFQQLSVTNPIQILNNPLNTSSSKFQYSFSKQPRFSKNKTVCLEAFYNSKDGKNKRSAAIGYGKKSDFTKSTVYAPPPNSYNMRSSFERNDSAHRGKSFGLSRDQLSEFGYILKGPLSNPGPGKYESKSPSKTEGYSIRPKTTSLYNPVFLDGKTTFQKNPGPGTYPLGDTITKLGRQTVSNFKSSGASAFNPPSSQRFPRNNSAAPGPGTYKPQNDLDLSGHYVLSQNKGNGTRSFPSQARRSFTDIYANKSFSNKNNPIEIKQCYFLPAPGPGNYRIPSDFGNYDHIDLYRTSGEFYSTKKSSLRPNSAIQN